MNLSPHFTRAEFTASATAQRKGIDNSVPQWATQNLIRLCAELEKVRTLTGKPLRILSGYRCPALNAAVGGSPRSYHMFGLAADFDPPQGWTHDQLQQAIAKEPSITFDLVLEEQAKDGAHWLHFQVPKFSTSGGRRLVRDAELDRQGGKITRTTAG